MLIANGVWNCWFWIEVWKLDVAFSGGPASIEQIALRWIHIVAAIIWVGFLSFFLLAVAPTLKSLDPATRAKVFPELASRGLWWLRWSSVAAWLAGFRYFMILAKTDAVNAGRPHAWGGWIGIWLVCWLAAFTMEMALIRAGGALGNKFVIGTLVVFIMTANNSLKPFSVSSSFMGITISSGYMFIKLKCKITVLQIKINYKKYKVLTVFVRYF